MRQTRSARLPPTPAEFPGSATRSPSSQTAEDAVADLSERERDKRRNAVRVLPGTLERGGHDEGARRRKANGHGGDVAKAVVLDIDERLGLFDPRPAVYGLFAGTSISLLRLSYLLMLPAHFSFVWTSKISSPPSPKETSCSISNSSVPISPTGHLQTSVFSAS